MTAAPPRIHRSQRGRDRAAGAMIPEHGGRSCKEKPWIRLRGDADLDAHRRGYGRAGGVAAAPTAKTSVPVIAWISSAIDSTTGRSPT